MTTKRSRAKALTSKPASSSSSTSSCCKKTKSREDRSSLSMEALSSVDDGVSVQEGLNESSNVAENGGDDLETRFLGEPIAGTEARLRWPKRYMGKKKQKLVAECERSKEKDDDSKEIIQAQCHYMQAEVDGVRFNLNDDAYVKAEDGEDNYICRIVEMFKAVDGGLYFSAQWFYRPKDTVLKDNASLIDPKRVFLSEIRDDNPLDCLVRKLKIISVPLNMDSEEKKSSLPESDYYYDMLYLLPYSTFVDLPPAYRKDKEQASLKLSSDVDMKLTNSENVCKVHEQEKPVITLLDVYAGCGAMSTGLCLGANMSGLNLVTKWAVDLNKYACESHKLNHPETEVRNESAEDFLSLLKEWEKLCCRYALVGNNNSEQYSEPSSEEDIGDEDSNDENDDEKNSEVFVVESILGVCYGDPNQKRKRGLYFKIRWKGYGPDEDSWEPSDGLSDCQKTVKDFVMQCYKSKTLPLPGDVDVICGGPPCQGISGFNRFRNKDNPLDDEKNKQLVVFMEIVEYLKPKFVLMENVVDIVKFAGGFLGRYALARLVQMNYKVRLGMLAAGAYGLPQFRMRVFLWGACPTEKLPPYPLPTHDVVIRGVIPVEFEMHTVAYDESHKVELERKLLLEDAISDLPAVANDESSDIMDYDDVPRSEFQRIIRLNKDELLSGSPEEKLTKKLYDHRPLQLNVDDYQRTCMIPKRKGANFRHLPGVRVRSDNKVEFDPAVERVYLESKKPLVPDYAMTFVRGTSSKPFARLWWDETVPTVVTRAEPHNQAILHPEQDRVLTIRENARLQGFPDYYRLCGTVKERYIQVGNAVAVPVAKALGYALGLSYLGLTSSEPLLKLPRNFLIKEIQEDSI